METQEKPEWDEVFDEERRSEYFWCLHCERTYKDGQFRKVDGFQMCPYQDCDGDAVTDAWDWATVRDNHPEYPEVPEPNKVYPLNT